MAARRASLPRKRGRRTQRPTSTVGVLLLLLLLLLLHVQAALAQDVSERKVQQRNSYLDLWSNVFDVLDKDAIDAEVLTLEEGLNDGESPDGESDGSGDPSAGEKPKHRLMDILESRRKEKRSASLLKGLSSPSKHPIGGMFASQPLDVAARNPRAPSKLRQLGIPVDAASFQSKLCFKMQNLGNADKYFGVVAGAPGCDENDQSAYSLPMTWHTHSMFTIDCSVTSAARNATNGSSQSSSPSSSPTSVPSIRAALGGKREAGGLYTDVELAVSSVASCSLAVVSENAESAESGVKSAALHSHKPTGVMLQLTDVALPSQHAIDVPLNAIKIKLCNLPSASAWSIDAEGENEDGVDGGSPASVTLPTLKLNGKRVTSQTLEAQAGSTCLTHTYRVPSVGLSSDGFVLSGSMDVNEGLKLGAGRASGVEISFGIVDSLGRAGGDENGVGI